MSLTISITVALLFVDFVKWLLPLMIEKISEKFAYTFYRWRLRRGWSIRSGQWVRP
jgi:hypothetical protein